MLHFLPLVRKDRNLTLDQLARAAGTHRDRVARLERGERPNNPDIIQRLANALGVPADVLTAESITITRGGDIRVTR